MTPLRDPKYFIVKHDLASLKALPHVIWRTGLGRNQKPRGFGLIEKGDRWISFAYTTSDNQERALSHITAFSQCTETADYGKAPRDAHKGNAWMIKGKPYGQPLRDAVAIPPIQTFLSKKIFGRNTINEISRKDFDRIQRYTADHWLDPKKIPLIERAPRSEQELLAIIASCHKAIGIERILRVQTRFPDMLVKVNGKELHLELEVYSSAFLDHDHNKQVRERQFKDDNGVRKSVAVLCWIDDDGVKDKKLKRYVRKVYALETLIREGETIRW
ncbi:MAG: hypothetical protein HY848_01270 [Betaproteobacteria bacterium]|nr:hypothetical protein [Betaproteobacteria bacterium]